MSKLKTLRKSSRLHGVLILLCLVWLELSRPSLALSGSDYEEEIRMEVEITGDIPASASVRLQFELTAITGSIDSWTTILTNEPSLKHISMSWRCRWYESSLRVGVVLDSSQIDGVEEGKSIAETIRKGIEGVWGIEFLYVGSFVKTGDRVWYDGIYYGYDVAEEYSLQKLRDIFLHYCPSEGFGKILHSMIPWGYVDIDLDLELDEQNEPVWDILFRSRYDNYLHVNAHQEFTVSLKELTGYAEPIQSSPRSLSSVLNVKVLEIDKQFGLICIGHLPKLMDLEGTGHGTSKERGQIVYEEWSRTFVKDIKHRRTTTDDLAVSFLVGKGPITLLLGPLAAYGAVIAIVTCSLSE